MKHLKTFGTGFLAAAAVLLSAQYLAPKLPDKVAVAGRDLRPLVVGGTTLGVIMTVAGLRKKS